MYVLPPLQPHRAGLFIGFREHIWFGRQEAPWSATAHRELTSHLLPDIIGRLRNASAAFNDIGAKPVAKVLSSALLGLRGSRSEVSEPHVRQLAMRIEDEILARDCGLDTVLERAALTIGTDP